MHCDLEARLDILGIRLWILAQRFQASPQMTQLHAAPSAVVDEVQVRYHQIQDQNDSEFVHCILFVDDKEPAASCGLKCLDLVHT